ncbi:DUF4974 domain-containing protein [Chitinophaga silvatica]|uniref:DUF4974 domain-containing protein n=1 Tax=Chitinophaga silvatica TaxID=2282649 RepID=A0A3E1YGI2_9BACT|nr:FecR family protein [Chitinophaga silvatica]RFS26310.1 DUF4974 domain-containing protein [Chitinophaga silvatica]
MTKEGFLQLYKKYLEGQCSQEEMKVLFEYQDEMQLEDEEWNEVPGVKWWVKERIRRRLDLDLQFTGEAKYRHLYWKKYAWRAAAACVIVIISIGTLNKYYSKPKSIVHASANTPVKTTGVSLTLGNGKTIALSAVNNEVVTNTSGVTAKKLSNAELAYAHEKVTSQQPAEINTLKTPTGLRYSVTLSDGSKVHLNASSSLQYPVYFTGKQREVILTGEAFFEVNASAESPFIVHVNNQKIQALGTGFNIKAYNTESKTTLINGAVNVVIANTSRLLAIGEQLQYNSQTNKIALQEVNTETVLAWKNGLFAFDREPFADIMLEIGRWYNMEVVFAEGDKYKKFTGTILRYEKLEDVLIRLEKTGAMKFQLDSKKIIVSIP